MADNVAITAGAGTTIAADDIGAGVLAQRVKPVWGVDGIGNDINAVTPLPVSLANQHTAGTNGFVVNPFTIFSSTELSALGVSSTVISAASGTSGKFNQASFSNAAQALLWFTAIGSAVPTAGGNLSIWFIPSTDGGTTFEATKTNTGQARPPDVIIPLPTSVVANDVIFAPVPVQVPWPTFKAYLQNNAGTALSANNHTVTIGPVQ